MNFQPLPDPRNQVLQDLNAKIDSFFASGKTASEIPAGVSGEGFGHGMDRHHAKLRAQRDKDAPTLKYLIEQGYGIKQAADAMGCDQKRVKLIARENGLTFGGPL
ncbi:hypothetical protein [Pseudomonas sp. R5(2019)]|uniref:hypothetical protein n=1 Tax=Pseudomonas sp. R5(2019) TaxID=2697566 RepID=UPI001412CECE|nr:hypothetical protein [Pseudomonas sp. R5(2019)]NBA95541.1 hypothetical protein [Pseudomonas sp. R5(2019)]